MTVRFSTRAPNADYLGFEASPEAIIAAAKKAEAVGFDAIFVNDHIIVGDDARSALEKLGEATGTQPKSLIRMFGARGNPQAKNLFSVLGYLQKQAGLRLHVTTGPA
jgi:hypothetical protein